MGGTLEYYEPTSGVSGDDKPVLVAFLKKNDSYEKQLAELKSMVGKRHGLLRVIVCRDESLEEGMRRYLVTGTPTYLLLRSGWEVSRLIGVADTRALDDFINNSLSLKSRGLTNSTDYS